MTIRPSKHSNPDQTIIGVAALLLKTLSKAGVEKYDILVDLVDSKIEGGKHLFLPALNLLYLLGAVDYHKKADVLRFFSYALLVDHSAGSWLWPSRERKLVRATSSMVCLCCSSQTP